MSAGSLLALSALASAAFGAQTPRENPVRVACVGDSITYGSGVEDRERNCYPALLGALLGDGYEVRNFGVGGATLLRAGDKPYVNEAAYQEALASEPDVVTIKLGTNDTKSLNWVHVESFVEDYKALIASFQALPSNPRIVLCLPVPCFVEGDDICGSRVRDGVIPMVRQVAYETGCEVVDLHTPMLQHSDWVPDSVHPNGFGAEFIARKLYETLSFETDPDYDVGARIEEEYTVTEFHGYRQYDFERAGRECRIVEPKIAAEGHPWIWRARFFGWEPQADLGMLEHGWHIVYCDVASLFGAPKAVSIWNEFYPYTQALGLNPKPVLAGISRGGLIVYNWAAENPEKVAAISCYAPVLDIRSWPAGLGAGPGNAEELPRCLEAYGITEADLTDFHGNPLDHLEPIAEARIPIIHYVGAADTDVPPAENTDILVERYTALGAKVEVISVLGMGHHPPAYNTDDLTPVVDFLLRATGRKPNFAAIPAPSVEFRGEEAGWGGGTWWGQFEKLSALASERAADIHVLFLGDSITQGFTGSEQRLAVEGGDRAFDKAFGSLGAASFGISGDRTENILYRIEHGNLEPLDPKVIVLMIGVNNLCSGRYTGEEVAEGTRAIVERIRAMKPNARILLLGSFPTGATPDSPTRLAVDALHAGVAPLADGDHVRYMDLRPLFLNPDGTINHTTMGGDDVHITGAGYEAWAEAVRPVVEEMMGG